MDTHAAAPIDPGRGRWRPSWLVPTLLRPRETFRRIADSPVPVWLTPIILLTASAILLAVAAGPIKQAAAANAQVDLPPGFEYYTPEQQAQFYQAQSAANSPTFVYILPAGLAAIKVWAGWLLLSGALHLVVTILGGRSSFPTLLNLSAWAGLPFALRDFVRIAYMLLSRKLILAAGLSGLLSADPSGMQAFLAELLKPVDVYLLWHVGLLIVALRAADSLTARRVWAGVVLTQTVLLLLQALPPYALGRLGSLTIMRPYFFF